MYHIELRERRQFGHVAFRFNMTDHQLRALCEPWGQRREVEVGERKWSPRTAELTVLEGPEVPLSELSMGRGWRAAERHGTDVTERVLAGTAGEAPSGETASGSPPRPAQRPDAAAGGEVDLEADSLGLGLLSLVEDAPAPLSGAWRLAQARFPERSASESLALAERAVSALIERGLVGLVGPAPPGGDQAGGSRSGGEAPAGELAPGGVEPLLGAVESWSDADASAVRIARA